jgi:hypothetical protein
MPGGTLAVVMPVAAGFTASIQGAVLGRIAGGAALLLRK